MDPPKGVLSAVIEASGAAFLALDGDGTILGVNPRFSTSWGIPPEALAPGTLAKLVEWLASSGGEGEKALAALLTNEHPPSGGDLEASTGRTFCFTWTHIAGGRGRAWAFMDVSERHHLELGLRDAGELLRILEAHIDGVVLELDTEARVVGRWSTNEMLADAADRALQGRRLDEIVGATAGAKLESLVRLVFSTGEPRSDEYAVELRGERHVLAAEARLMPSGAEEAPRVTVMFRDVTERARMQMRLLETERLASFGLLAAGVAHEINNPLAYLLLNLERIEKGLKLLASSADGPLVGELLDNVALSREGGRRVQTIVNDLRRFSRADAGQPNLPIDIRRVLDFAIDMAGHEVHKRARVVRAYGDVPLVSASENRLIQVFLNLIVNAAHAIGEGAPDDNEIRVVTRTDEQGRAVIEVFDTGEGMSPTVLQHIFEPFYTTKPAGLGTGLGLAICRDITASLGGDIAVESERGRGTVFRVLLPSA